MTSAVSSPYSFPRSTVPQPLELNRRQIDIAENAAERADLKVLVPVYRDSRSFSAAVHEVVGAADSNRAQSLTLKESDHLLTGRPGKLSHGRVPSGPKLRDGVEA